jgi:hypothetical protein
VPDQPADQAPGAPAPDATLTLTRADIEALIDARVESRTEGYRRKVNGELASFRKKLGGGAEGDDGSPQPSSSSAPSVDPKALLSLGARLSALDEAKRGTLLEEFGAMPDVLERVLKVLETSASPASAPDNSTATGTGRPQPQPTTRGAPPAPAGGGLPTPRTVKEYVEQAKDPKRRAALKAMPDFDPTTLPPR